VTLDELRSLAASVGFPDPSLAAAIAMAESGGNPRAAAIVTDPAPGNLPERSFGLWQINTLASPQYDETRLFDPSYNAHAAYAISQGGANWRPWSTFTKGLYRRWYRPAPAAARGGGGTFMLGAVLGLSAVLGYVWWQR
jgi:Lysozyme like domain